MAFNKGLAVALCGAAVISAAILAAQEGQPRTEQPQLPRAQQGLPNQPGQRAQWQNADQTLASCVAIDNQLEVALAQLVQDKVEHKDVKEFAKMLIEDHQAFLKKLQRFAPEATRDGYLDDKAAHQITSTKSGVEPAKATTDGNQPARTVQQTNATQPTAGSRSEQQLDFVQLHREIAQECLSAAKKELEKKEHSELDQCFIGFQIAKHAAMKDKLTVFQRHTSGELAQLFSDGAETTEKHLKQAEEIMETLSKDKNASGSKREQRREERRNEKK